MKTNTFKLFTVLALMLTMSCSVDNLQEDYETTKLEKSLDTETSTEKEKNQQSRNAAPNQQENGDPIPLNDIPFGTQTYTMYRNMDSIEAQYQSTYSGSFSEHYRNEMMTHYTIYTVQYSNNPECGNIEKWVVNLDEYNAYRTANGDETVGGNTGNSTGGGNTSNTTGGEMADSDGKKAKGGGSNDNDDDEVVDPDEPDMSVDYSHCFGPDHN